jgi:putative ABC transport system substrate-binding protein
VSLLKQYLSLVLFNLLLTFCASAYGEQTNKVPRLGYLSGTGTSPNGDFIGQLRDLGNVEGKNITVAFRTAQGQLNQLSEIALKMARSSVDVIFASDFNSAVASKNATQSIPIVFQTLGDPVASGLVNSLARPGRNLTGVAGFGPELSGKRLEIIREVVPGMSRIAFLTDPSNAAGAATLRETEAAARHSALLSRSIK